MVCPGSLSEHCAFDTHRSARSVLADASDEAGDDLRRKGFEGGHFIATFANHLGDLLIRHLCLPFTTGEIGCTHHRTLRSITATHRAMTTCAVAYPRQLHEALVRAGLSGRARLCCNLALSYRLLVIGRFPFAHVVRRATATCGDERKDDAEKQRCKSSILHDGGMTESSAVGERFSGANDHGLQLLLEFGEWQRRFDVKSIEPAVLLREATTGSMCTGLARLNCVQTSRLVITARTRLSRPERWHRPGDP
jgi:hypothetical protein